MQWTRGISALVLTVDSITLITGLPANLLALFTFIRKVKQNAKPIDILLLSLTLSDLVFLFFLPFRMKQAIDMRWTMSYFLCPLSSFIFYSSIHNSTLHLTAISVERYLGVAFPIKYKLRKHPQNAAIACFLFWVISMGHCSVIYVVQYYKHINNNTLDASKRNICYEEFSDEQLKILLPVRFELFLVLFLIPLLICCFCYINFIHILYRLPNINRKKRFRAIGLAIGTLVVFIVCFMPFSVSHVVGYIQWKSPDWRLYALFTSTFNACLDPFIFYFSSSQLRQAFKNCIQVIAKRLHLTCCLCYSQKKRPNVDESTPSFTNSSRLNL